MKTWVKVLSYGDGYGNSDGYGDGDGYGGGHGYGDGYGDGRGYGYGYSYGGGYDDYSPSWLVAGDHLVNLVVEVLSGSTKKGQMK
jgi:hypothetical protein